MKGRPAFGPYRKVYLTIDRESWQRVEEILCLDQQLCNEYANT